MSLDCFDMFDFSDYPTDHPLFNITNKKVETLNYMQTVHLNQNIPWLSGFGKMKDETAGKPIK